MRQRHPQRLLAQRRDALARVKIVQVPESGHSEDGSITSKQTARVTLPRSELDRIWTPEYLERLARTYWRFLTRVSLGTLRVLYTEDAREIALIGRPFVLLRFHRPEYDFEGHRGTVTWPIERGALVAPQGRGKGFLRISVRRDPTTERGDQITGEVSSEVANFYPTIAGSGQFARIGRAIYRVTQLRIHIIITNAFLRSLARLDLEESVVGALKAGAAREDREKETAGASSTAG
ncbi:MAG: hypothetical protein M3350_06210 [Actinomycetota bacterium]|nr:hypothetical protein [Actinomycetota bacterium]